MKAEKHYIEMQLTCTHVDILYWKSGSMLEVDKNIPCLNFGKLKIIKNEKKCHLPFRQCQTKIQCVRILVR